MFAAFKNSAATRSLLLICVVNVLLTLTHGQAYHFIIGHHPRHFDQLYRETNTKPNITVTNLTDTTTAASDLENLNSTIIVTTLRETQSGELSQTTMEIITIIWYVATFLALAAFFLLMSCSDRRCSDTQRNGNMNNNEQPIPPPLTPTPSYSEFAPPSYESVMKQQLDNKSSIFILPFTTSNTNQEQNAAKDDSGHNITATLNTTNSNISNTEQTPIPNINVYTINELQQKVSS